MYLFSLPPRDIRVFRSCVLRNTRLWTLSLRWVPWPTRALGYRKVGQMQAGVRDPQIWGHINHEYDFQPAIAVPRVPVEGCYEDLAL